jgi:putative zinc finger/helix-turn-helix YgiT family protein
MSMKERTIDCPSGHGAMKVRQVHKKTKFRGVNIDFPVQTHVCRVCGLEAGSVEQAAVTQRRMSDAYRKAVGLLTGEEMRNTRKKLGLNQAELATRMSVGIASIKRWEGGLIQSKSMDQALRRALKGESAGNLYSGNRSLSLARVKLVLKELECHLGRPLLKANDRMLYAAKYLWYSDFACFAELGESLTGATYAALPQGPQLNNYRDLIGQIRSADESNAEPLTPEERRVIKRVSMAFPSNRDVYRAAHGEPIWKERPVGALIPYSEANQLKAL